ncbi:hypothetical protein CVT26_010358 [Gymnopilus dilepis]|uniref:ABC transporter domain-containing protein n=1 Tax=Gymnopilus dilepis TaxID=231916 RepID=A0A409W503_9AGAR|nr:hypothetical protein CVT26_010358 [Gymnopilus dilepis]
MALVPAISAANLTYSYNSFSPPSLIDINLHLPPGSRTILIGANGAGKSTLLQILAGKKLVNAPNADVRIKGQDVFRHTPPGVTFLGTEWAMNPVVRGDIVVSAFLDSVGGYRHKERRDRLLDILDIDLDWHMHQISDGERRRVQLCFGLMVPWDVLLLDEVTVDLDVLVRDDLLNFLKKDSEDRGATILYATHIFDGLNNFPTHIAHMRFGTFVTPPTPWNPVGPSILSKNVSAPVTLYQVALQWLKEDRDHRLSLEKQGKQVTRGARRDETVPTDSEIFYRKYDYSFKTRSSLPCKLLSEPRRFSMPAAEIIDLTTPLGSDAEDTATPAESQPSQKQEGRKKRKRKPKGNSSRSNTQAPPNSSTSIIDLTSPGKWNQPNEPERVGESNEKAGDDDTSRLFFIDTNPAPIASTHQIPTESTANEEKPRDKLLVPSHVTVLGSTPVEILPKDLPDDGDDDFIDYVDLEDMRPSHRYYDDAPDENVTTRRTVCKNCGAEGEHKTSACPVQICLTCGVRDEHSTRSCPISKVCFTCGMKGHINSNCPNRRSARSFMFSQGSECDRCSSSRHKTNECPTLWRLYKYFSVEERSSIISIRQSKKEFALGEGGEGYIADDEWCYNCGSYGHWGDDCHELHQDNSAEDFSAFSSYNIMSGPFFDPSQEARTSGDQRTRAGRGPDPYKWEMDLPSHVGRQGRMKSKANLAQQAQRMEENTDDWFRSGGKRYEPPPSRPKEPKKIKFGKLGNGANSHSHTPAPPSLMDRLGDIQRTDTRRNGDSFNGKGRRNDDKRSSNRSQQAASGPRYRGGYAR